MNRSTRLLSSFLVLAGLGFADNASSDSTKQLPKTVTQTPPRSVATPDKVKVAKLEVGGTGATKTIKLLISNVSNDSATWMPWSLKWKAGSVQKYLGMGTIDSLNGGQSKTFSFEFVVPEGAGVLEAVIDPAHEVETNSAMWPSNTRSVNVTGSAPAATPQLIPFDVSQATGAVHEYKPRTGMTGCTMAAAPTGPTLTVNMTCTAQGAGDLLLFKGGKLKNGFKLNAISVGSLGGTVATRRLPLAGGDSLEMGISVGGSQGNAPVVFVAIDVFGPAGQSPF
jgi:hypothetical protein